MAENIDKLFDALTKISTSTVEHQSTSAQLDRIEKLLGDISKNVSQSAAQDFRNAKNAAFEETQAVYNRRNSSINSKRSTSVASQFSSGVEDAIKEAIGVGDFEKEIGNLLNTFADELGTSIEDLPKQFGQRLTESALDALKDVGPFKEITDQYSKWKDQAISNFEDMATDKIKSFAKDNLEGKLSETLKKSGLDKLSTITDKLGGSKTTAGASKILSQGLEQVTSGAGGKIASEAATQAATKAAGSLLSKGSMSAVTGLVSKGILAAIPGVGEIAIAIQLIPIALEVITDWMGKIFASWAEYFKAMKAASNRGVTTRARRVELANERLRADITDIVKAPFETLQKAAEAVYQAWDSNLRLINQTQGYSKADLQSLMGAYSSRLKSEGLGAVISSAEITEGLANVLKSGLSGKAAEEFAYQATKLNAAMPTQDFFSYAEAYAALASNAVKSGKSQSDAISYANSQLELFASDVAYASRQLTGGFNTGLQNASDLFSKAVEISIAARTNDPSQLAGVLTSVSAITGAIAPDLASSIVDAIYNSAVGGNNSQIVALRSLAGINASNTEFLQQFAASPQKVFSTLFQNLARMQNMSESNYMEVAEGLSNIFGLDSSAFARVDFSYLSKAIDNMNVSDAALTENMKALASGQSTSNADQARIREINEYMMNEGLAYVLDNEVARSIQEHMWDEQIAQQIQEAEYGVDLRGAAMEHLNRMVEIGLQILHTLIPVTNLTKLYNLQRTRIEALDDAYGRIPRVLEAGKVGQGNEAIKRALNTRGKDLKLTNTYLEQLLKSKLVQGDVTYTWKDLGKSAYASLGTSSRGEILTFGGGGSSSGMSQASIASAINLKRLETNFNKMLSTMSNFFGTNIKSKIDEAIEKEKSRLAKSALGKITQSTIDALAQKYLSDPEKYGIADILYSSKLANASAASNLSKFNQEVQQRALELTKERVKKDLESSALLEAADLAQQNISKLVSAGKFGQSGYEAWAATASKFGIANLSEAFTELGYDPSDVMNYFTGLESQSASEKAIKREQDEEKFWSETQRLLELANTNIHDVLDKGDLMSIFWPGVDSWLSDIDSNGTSGGKTVGGTGFRGEMNSWFDKVDSDVNLFHTEMVTEFKGFRTDWTNYYIKHTDYNSKLGMDKKGSAYNSALDAIKKAEKKTAEDKLNALTEALTTNPIEDLMDPTVQQNVFLAQILRVVQGIFQQNNTQGKLKLPDAIAALATGMTVSEVGAAPSTTSTTTSGSTGMAFTKSATPLNK